MGVRIVYVVDVADATECLDNTVVVVVVDMKALMSSLLNIERKKNIYIILSSKWSNSIGFLHVSIGADGVIVFGSPSSLIKWILTWPVTWIYLADDNGIRCRNSQKWRPLTAI